jgi:hypothetical protein
VSFLKKAQPKTAKKAASAAFYFFEAAIYCLDKKVAIPHTF